MQPAIPMPLSTKVIRVPVKLVDGQWELLYGGPVKVRDCATGELHLDKSSFDDAKFLKALTVKRCVPILPAGTQLQVALSVKPGLSQPLHTCLLKSDASTHGHTEHLSTETQFVSVSLGGPTARQKRHGLTDGGLKLWLEGMEPRSIESGTVELPNVTGLPAVDSLNHAFTKLSELFEPWRKAHTGSIYERVFYLESNGLWYPLKDLRDRALVAAERGLIKELWGRVAAELGTALFK